MTKQVEKRWRLLCLVLRISALALPFATIYAIEHNSRNATASLYLTITSLGFLGSAFFANDYYGSFYSALIESTGEAVAEFKNYFSVQLWQTFLVMPIILALSRPSSIIESTTLLLFLVAEKVYDEQQRLSQFLDSSAVAYSYILFTRRLLLSAVIVTTTVLQLAIVEGFVLFNLVNIFSILLTSIILLRLLKRLGYDDARVGAMRKLLSMFHGISGFLSIPSSRLTLLFQAVLSLSTTFPLYLFSTLIPSSIGNQFFSSFLLYTRILSVPFVLAATLYYPQVRIKIMKYPSFMSSLRTKYGTISVAIVALYLTACFLIFSFDVAQASLQLYALLYSLLSSSFILVDECIFWRYSIRARAIAYVFYLASAIIVYFIFMSYGNLIYPIFLILSIVLVRLVISVSLLRTYKLLPTS
jgi:hypothetical protein